MKHWSEESLRGHIEIAHPHLASSERAVHLLWRIFHFYAFHPFPRNYIEGRIDWEAFQRAVTLLAAQGADLLGILEEIESYWRFDGDNLYDQAKLKRIFRSIGTPADSANRDDESTHVLNETIDVLAMTQPFFMHNGPHEHQLTPTARRLLGEGLIRARRVTHGDFETLVNILIRLNLSKETWGLSFPFGSFELSDPSTDELADILASEVEGGQRQEILGFDSVNQINSLLMWAVLFQPVMTNYSEAHARGSSHTTGPILGSVSLFTPYPVVSTLRESRAEERRIALENSITFTNDVTAAGVSGALTKDSHSHILLVTGINAATSEPTVFGAFLAPKSEVVASHLFFQLRPRFRVRRLSDIQGYPLHIVENTEEALSPNSVTGSQNNIDKDPTFDAGRSSESNCIIIDLANKLVTLTGFPTDVEDHDFSKQNGSNSHNMTQRKKVEVLFSDITISRVSGSVSPAVPGLVRKNWASNPPADFSSSSSPELRIHGDELRSRIMGFGSSS
ncbi:hypothetical protein F1880_000616 [Penicillium rolfsii]|nr:hypothetical protein F1880_000616 [Penicillium rolfsii]